MKVLAPVDGSRSSKVALRFIASTFGRARTRPRIELLNVQVPIPSRAARFVGAHTVHEYHDAESKAILAPAAATLVKAGLQVRSVAAVGSPGTVVSDAARAADLVVMGAHGHTATAGLLLGSVTNTVLASCTTPMLIVRPKSRARNVARRAPLRIGIALDAGGIGLAGLRYVLAHPALFGANAALTLINVVPDLLSAFFPGISIVPAPMFSVEHAVRGQTSAYEAAMEPARKLLRRARRKAGEAFLIGNAAGDEIAAYAKKHHLDLLVLGSHGYGAIRSVALGSVATRVAAQCAAPLLLIRSA